MKNFKPSTKVFYILLCIILVLGCFANLRPKISELEKRQLEPFPALSAKTIWDGSFLSGLSTWYSDTFPMREQMINLNSKLKKAYGISEEAIYGQTNAVAEDIPDTEEVTEAKVLTKEEVEELTDGAGTIGDAPEYVGSVYVADGMAFEMVYYDADSSNAYASTLNTIRSMLPEDVNLYDMVIPNSLGVYMDEELLDTIGASNQGEMITDMYARMSDDIKKVDTYDYLRSKNDEYLYFRTDHHWTARGAYHAYEKFCEMKGIEPHSLDDFETANYGHFLGSFYASTNQSQVLYDNMDSIEAFIPNGTNFETILQDDGTILNWEVVHDVSDYNDYNRYSCFIGGDHPLITIENPEITDGSSCVILKESYGNAFVPFLVDHYQTVYVVDYRYGDGGLVDFVKEKGIDDVILLNVISAITVSKSNAILSQFM